MRGSPTTASSAFWRSAGTTSWPITIRRTSIWGRSTSMSRFIIRADALVTMNDQHQVIPNGAAIVNGNRIEAVGTAAELSTRGPFDRDLGGTGFVLLPGLI